MKRLFKFKTAIVSNQNLYKVYPPPFRWMEAFVLRHTDIFFGVTGSVLPVWEKKGMSKERLKVLCQVGVNMRQFKPLNEFKKKYGVKKFCFGYAGRLVEEKGVHILIRAFAMMKNRPHCELLLFGGGPYKNNLMEEIKKFGMEGQVRFVEGIKHHQMPEGLNALDVLVLPSLVRPHWKEQFGHVIIEAQACGKPVLGSDCDPIPEVIGRGGVWAKTESAEDFRDKMDSLYENPKLMKELSDEALKNVSERFTNERIAQTLISHFSEIMQPYQN